MAEPPVERHSRPTNPEILTPELERISVPGEEVALWRCDDQCPGRLTALSRVTIRLRQELDILRKDFGRLPTLTDPGEGLSQLVAGINSKLDKLIASLETANAEQLKRNVEQEKRNAPFSRIGWFAVGAVVTATCAGITVQAITWIASLHH